MKKRFLSLLLSLVVILNSVSFTACTCVWIADMHGDSNEDDDLTGDPLYEKYSDFDLKKKNSRKLLTKRLRK